MQGVRWLAWALCALATSTLAALPEISIPDKVSVVATRTVDLTSQIVKASVEYEITNNGQNDLNNFVHVIPEKEEHVAWISAHQDKKTANKLRVARVEVIGAAKGFAYYKVELLSLVPPGKSVTVTVDYSLTGFLQPFPAEIPQSENQFVLFNGFGNVVSAYPVAKETSVFRVGSSNKIVSHTTVNPTKQESGKITYGPFTDNAAYTQKPITLHYENNAPFVVATEVERVIEVSHWGNIAVEDHIEVVHKGAKLKGSFSRLDFQMDRRGNKQPVVRGFKTVLPDSARDIYYRDYIGNISTSVVSARSDKVEVELRPRFPLFGGWKTNYVLGYNLPASGFLFSSGSDHALKMRLFDQLFDNVVVERLRVRIILPETCKNIKLVTPYSVKRLPDETHQTYLDTVGRPVIVLEKENLVPDHIQPFTLYYEFERVYLLREPLIVVVAVFILFLAVIFFVRLDFSILPESGEARAHAKKD